MRYDLTNSELLAELLKSIPEDDSCMEWLRARHKQGYGEVNRRTSPDERHAHRAAWVMVHGPIPDGVDILHKCDNPPCFRPDHLFPGDQGDNMRDCAAKGRTKRTLTLDADRVSLIRELHGLGALQRDLAKAFTVSHVTISLIVRRKTWKSF